MTALVSSASRRSPPLAWSLTSIFTALYFLLGHECFRKVMEVLCPACGPLFMRALAAGHLRREWSWRQPASSCRERPASGPISRRLLKPLRQTRRAESFVPAIADCLMGEYPIQTRSTIPFLLKLKRRSASSSKPRRRLRCRKPVAIADGSNGRQPVLAKANRGLTK
jgi:hypothetical protein